MDHEERLPDREYVITTPEEPLPEDGEIPMSADGGGAVPPRKLLETRERLSAVETAVDRNGQLLASVDDKVDGIRQDIQEVDSKTLDEDYFEENYKSTIEANSDIATLLVWGGGILLAIIGIVTTLLSAGVL